MAGPTRVAGHEAGDVLQLEVVDVTSADWGWTAVVPGLGLLSEDFPESHYHR